MSFVLEIIKNKKIKANSKCVLFTSFDGRYSDSPRSISEYLHDISPDTPIVWQVSAEQAEYVPSYAKVILNNSEEAKVARNKSHIIVDNVFCASATSLISSKLKDRLIFAAKTIYKTKKSQVRITTWHGTPLKKMGRDQVGSKVIDFTCPNTIMLLGNTFTEGVMRRITFGKIPIKLFGTPRNDALFKLTDDDIRNAKLQLGIAPEKKIVLFAPTFRSDSNDVNNTNVFRSGIEQLKEMDIGRLLSTLKNRFSSEWVLVCRFHYHVDAFVDWNSMYQLYNGMVINGNTEPDITKYLIASDVLITDASSCMFDYALTKRPCFLFFPDIDNYIDNERGIYFDMKELPFTISTKKSELYRSITDFNYASYIGKVQSFLDSIGNVEDGKATARAVDYILKSL